MGLLINFTIFSEKNHEKWLFDPFHGKVGLQRMKFPAKQTALFTTDWVVRYIIH